MNKFIKSLILVAGLSTFANAGVLFQTDNSDDEFAKMQNFVNSFLNSHLIRQPLSTMQNFNYPNVNIRELKDKYILKFELAGMDKKDIKLSLRDNFLILEGEQKSSKDDKEQNYITQEIFYGKFKRVVQLPKNTNIKKLTNKFDNGILTITIPKTKVTNSNVKVLKIN